MKKSVFLASAILIVMIGNTGIPSTATTHDNHFELDLLLVVDTPIHSMLSTYLEFALNEININVNSRFVTWNTYVGELLGGGEKNYDLAIVRYGDNNPYPSFERYYSQSSFGKFIYQLNDSNFKEFQLTDTSITTNEVDDIITQIDSIHETSSRYNLTQEFNELFMGHLLYDYPLVAKSTAVIIDENLDLYPNSLNNGDIESFLDLRKTGFFWQNNENRSVSPTSFQLPWVSSFPDSFDPYQLLDPSFAKLISEPLINIAYNFQTSPGLSYQWLEEWANGTSHQTFFLNSNFTFPATSAFNGEDLLNFESEPLDAFDIIFTIEHLKHLISNNFVGSSDFTNFIQRINSYQVNSTLNGNDTLVLEIKNGKPNDFKYFNSIYALPEHILNTSLHFESESGILSENIFQSTNNPRESIEWNWWSSLNSSSFVGNMEVISLTDNTLHLMSRPDYPYFSSKDYENVYQKNKNSFDDYEESLNLSIWAPHLITERIDSWEKSKLDNNLSFSDYEIIYRSSSENRNSLINLFNNYEIDRLVLTLEETEAYRHNYFAHGSLHRIHDKATSFNLVFNLLNEHLQKFNVRRAIASSIDTREIADLYYPTSLEGSETPIPFYYSDIMIDNEDTPFYQEFPIDYDIAVARDLMRLEGYFPLSPEPNFTESGTEKVLSDKQTSKNENDPPVEISWSFTFTLPVVLVGLQKVKRRK